MQLRYIYVYVLVAFVLGIGFISHTKPVNAAVTTKGITNNGLVGWWMFDEGTGSIAHDFSGNGIDGTFTNSPVWSAGKRGKSLYFNGSNTSVTTPDNNVLDITTNITLSVWYKEDVGAGSNRWLIDKGNVNSSYAMFLEGGLKMRLEKPGMQDCTVTEPSEGVWHHAVSTYDGSNMRVYVDGVLANTCVATGAISTTAVGVRIGSFESNGYAFKGFIDDARIYNRVLSETEIAALYRSGEVVRKNVSANGLVGHWTLDEGTSTIAHDFSGNSSNNFGTLSNFAFSGATSNWSTSGKRGGSVDFDGTNDQIYGSIPAATFSGDFTIAAWFNHRALTQWGAIFSNSVGTSETAIMTMRDLTTQMGIMRVGVVDSGVFVDLGADHYGKWIYGVITRQGSNLAVYAYKDGQLISSTGTLSWTLNTDNEFYIGRHYAGGAHIFNGKIDDVRVYNRALSTSEISTLYSQGALTINHSQNAKLTSGLIGLWSFNGVDMNWTSASAGTAYDRSGNNNHGTFMSMSQSTSVAPGVSGQAVSFNGSSSHIEVPNSSSLNPANLTVSTWAKSNTATWNDNGFLVSKRDMFVMHPSSGATGVSFYINNGGWVAASCTPVNALTVWNMYTMTWDGTNLRCYINGVAGSVTAPGGSINTADTGVLTIGKDDGIARYFNGLMDETRMYNRALTAAEVKQLYLMGK